jgi:hypothetical protein
MEKTIPPFPLTIAEEEKEKIKSNTKKFNMERH